MTQVQLVSVLVAASVKSAAILSLAGLVNTLVARIVRVRATFRVDDWRCCCVGRACLRPCVGPAERPGHSRFPMDAEPCCLA